MLLYCCRRTHGANTRHYKPLYHTLINIYVQLVTRPGFARVPFTNEEIEKCAFYCYFYKRKTSKFPTYVAGFLKVFTDMIIEPYPDNYEHKNIRSSASWTRTRRFPYTLCDRFERPISIIKIELKNTKKTTYLAQQAPLFFNLFHIIFKFQVSMRYQKNTTTELGFRSLLLQHL